MHLDFRFSVFTHKLTLQDQYKPTHLHTQVDEGWCEGTLNGERGLFPVNFIKMRPAKIPPPAQPPSEPPVVRGT